MDRKPDAIEAAINEAATKFITAAVAVVKRGTPRSLVVDAMYRAAVAMMLGEARTEQQMAEAFAKGPALAMSYGVSPEVVSGAMHAAAVAMMLSSAGAERTIDELIDTAKKLEDAGDGARPLAN
ncbi:MAG: hypothetical protein SGI91_01170 [Alphaproteobacteria bacterium]|nr:hypothetical protein [Alphaproteobacteria bacterium]